MITLCPLCRTTLDVPAGSETDWCYQFECASCGASFTRQRKCSGCGTLQSLARLAVIEAMRPDETWRCEVCGREHRVW